MKLRKVWFVPLALLCLGGAGVSTKMILEAGSSRELSKSTSSNRKSPSIASSKTKARGKKSDVEDVAKVRALLLRKGMASSSSQEELRAIENLIDSLSLEATLELLDDDEALADVEWLDGVAMFPLRPLIHGSLWHRLGELAPELALQRAFQNGADEPLENDHLVDMFFGIAKKDRKLALASWQTHIEHSDDDDLVSQADYFIDVLFEDWAKSSPDAAFSALGKLSAPWREDAYTGYISAFGEKTDWQAERRKFETLFPNPEARDFRPKSAICSLATRWAVSEAAAAFSWMESLPGNDRADAYGEVVSEWLRTEPTEAAEWLKSWKAPGNSDRFYANIIEQDGSQYVAIASTALELISDPAIRDKAVREVLIRRIPEHEVLRMWEHSSRLSPEVRAKVTETIRTRDEKDGG